MSLSTVEISTSISEFLEKNQVLTRESKKKLTSFSKSDIVARRALLATIQLIANEPNWLMILNSELEDFDESNIYKFTWNLYELCGSYKYDQEKNSM